MQNRVFAAEIASNVNRSHRPAIIERAAQLGIKVMLQSIIGVYLFYLSGFCQTFRLFYVVSCVIFFVIITLTCVIFLLLQL